MKVGIIQLTSVLDPEKNLRTIRKYLLKDKKRESKSSVSAGVFLLHGRWK